MSFVWVAYCLMVLLAAGLLAVDAFILSPSSYHHHGAAPFTTRQRQRQRPLIIDVVASPITTALQMAMDESMISRLENIRRSYAALTERLGDPDVISDSQLLRKVMSDRAESEDVVNTYDEYRQLQEELEGATELFQEAGDDADMREMARDEIKTIEPQLQELEDKIKVLLLPKDPNDDRNIVRVSLAACCVSIAIHVMSIIHEI